VINTKKPFVIILRKLFIILFTVISFGLYGQGSYVFFEPDEVDATLKAKPFYKNEVVLHVEKSEFKNGNNYITFYLINGSEKPLNILAAVGEKIDNVVSGLLLYHTKKDAPYDLIYDLGNVNPGKKPVEPVSSSPLVSINGFCWEEALSPGWYIKQTIKIPCAGCTKANKITARFTYEEYSENLLNYYFSNGFEMYHNGESLPEKKVQNVEPVHMVNLMVGGGTDYIHTRNLPYLGREILLADTLRKRFPGYEIESFDLLFIPKNEQFIIFHCKGNTLDEKTMEWLKTIQSGDQLLITEIKIKNNKEEKVKLAPVIYDVIDDTYSTSFYLGNFKKEKLSIKALDYLSETETVRIESKYTVAGFTLSSFTLTLMPDNGAIEAFSMPLKGNSIPAGLIEEIKSLPVSSIIAFSEVKLLNTETGEEKLLGLTTYKLVE
jgi:hypothetical protein